MHQGTVVSAITRDELNQRSHTFVVVQLLSPV